MSISWKPNKISKKLNGFELQVLGPRDIICEFFVCTVYSIKLFRVNAYDTVNNVLYN